MRDVTSEIVREEVKEERMVGEYLLLRWPAMLETLTRRPKGRMRGSRDWVAVRVP